jgi:hypothetical protein
MSLQYLGGRVGGQVMWSDYVSIHNRLRCSKFAND